MQSETNSDYYVVLFKISYVKLYTICKIYMQFIHIDLFTIYLHKIT